MPIKRITPDGLIVTDMPDARASMVTASEAPAIAGIDPRRTPLSLWAQKRGLIDPPGETEQMRWGKLLEPVVLNELAAIPNALTFVMPDHNIGATPDGFIPHDGRRVVEVKTTRWHPEILAYAAVQVQCQMLVTGAGSAVIAVLIGGQELRTWQVERHEGFCDWLLERMIRFLGHLESDTQPEPQAGDARVLAAIYPNPESSASIMLPDEAQAIDAEIQEHDAIARDHKAKSDTLRNQLRAMIGANESGVLRTGGRWQWSVTAKGIRTFRRMKR